MVRMPERASSAPQYRERIAFDAAAVALDDAVLARQDAEWIRRDVAVAPRGPALDRAVEEHRMRVVRERRECGRRVHVVQRLDDRNRGVAHAPLATFARAAGRRACGLS